MNMLAVAVTAAATILLVPSIDFGSHKGNLACDNASYMRATDSINDNGDFNQVWPEYPSTSDAEYRNHILSLQHIESMLRSHNTNGMPAELRAERARNLDRLHDYWMRGEFPRNYEHPAAWEPCFIDRNGAICAVGYLIEQSEGRAAAEKINRRYHFATIRQIDAPELAHWIAHSGLTKAEVVAIQRPTMRPDGRTTGIRVATDAPSLQQAVALSARVDNPVNITEAPGAAVEDSLTSVTRVRPGPVVERPINTARVGIK